MADHQPTDRLTDIERRLAALEAVSAPPALSQVDIVMAAERRVVELVVAQVGRAWMPPVLRAAVELLENLRGTHE
ncbi:hypothetical protein P7L78_09070 [Tistrella bauzanensis]|uniref:hypothetical protein n=1 Tax=Tistrella TaxID=171436 RepID=UPI0031F6C677